MKSQFITAVIEDELQMTCVLTAFQESDSGLCILRAHTTDVLRDIDLADKHDVEILPALLITSTPIHEGPWQEHMTFLKRVKDSGYMIPILVVTILPEEHEHYQKASILADRIISFPFGSEDLMSNVEEMLAIMSKLENV